MLKLSPAGSSNPLFRFAITLETWWLLCEALPEDSRNCPISVPELVVNETSYPWDPQKLPVVNMISVSTTSCPVGAVPAVVLEE